MASPTPRKVLETMARLVRDKLVDDDVAHVPHLGTFSVERQPSHMETDDEGRSVMIPPRDVIQFEPDDTA